GCRLVSVLVFFFSCSACYHRDPHSFPTRRSSDLDLRGELHWSWLRAAHRAEVEAYLDSLALGPEVTEQDRLLNALCRPERLLELDRKSTRLNSSHVKISYAVFCLKKKKEKRSASL